ncbi:hypothetical protein DL93DRAFT_2164388 [Clavulina sp. PMI_390]|nr:hypothetical protein DL93DRAFT_2164388 [Clavulina sp. PMI_390]
MATHYMKPRRAPVSGAAGTSADAPSDCGLDPAPKREPLPLPPEASILVFPSRAPSEPPSSPSPSQTAAVAETSPGYRRGSTARTSTTSIPTSLISSVDRRPLSSTSRSLSPSGDFSSWQDETNDSALRFLAGPSSKNYQSSLLTHDRVAQIESVRDPVHGWPQHRSSTTAANNIHHNPASSSLSPNNNNNNINLHLNRNSHAATSPLSPSSDLLLRTESAALLSDDNDVELWDWTSSAASGGSGSGEPSPAGSRPISLLDGRRPLSPLRPEHELARGLNMSITPARGRRERERRATADMSASIVSTQYQSASSQFYVSDDEDEDGGLGDGGITSEAELLSSPSVVTSTDSEEDFESMFFVALKTRRTNNALNLLHVDPHAKGGLYRRQPLPRLPLSTLERHVPLSPPPSASQPGQRQGRSVTSYGTSSFFTPKLLPLPFESILRFLFFSLPLSFSSSFEAEEEYDDAMHTLNLIKQTNGRPHPDNPEGLPPTGLFLIPICAPPTTSSDSKKMGDGDGELMDEKSAMRMFMNGEVRVAVRGVRRGLRARALSSIEEEESASEDRVKLDPQVQSISSSSGGGDDAGSDVPRVGEETDAGPPTTLASAGGLLVGVARLPYDLARSVLRL